MLVSPKGFAGIDDDECTLPHGKMVGRETDEFQRLQRRSRMKNWSIALTTTAIGIATLILVKQNHDK